MRGSGVNIIKISCMAFSELIKILVKKRENRYNSDKGEKMGRYCSMDIEFQFCKMKRL